MRWAARELRELQDKRGVRIYVTWPAVAGDDCYRTDSLQKAARQLFAENGISVVGDPADSTFAPSHMLDTYYHVDSAAATIRTERLIQRLSEAPGFVERSGADVYRSTAVQGAEAFRALASDIPRAADSP